MYKENDLVVIENITTATGGSKKLEPKFKEPYQVKKVLPHDRYVIKDIDGQQWCQRYYEFIYAADKMEPWCSNYPEFDFFGDDEDAEYNEDLSDEDQIEQEASNGDVTLQYGRLSCDEVKED